MSSAFLDVKKDDAVRIGAVACGVPVRFTDAEVARIWQAAAARNASKATQAWDAEHTWPAARVNRQTNDAAHAKGIAGEWAVARLLGLPELADVIDGHGDAGHDLRLPSSGQRIQVKYRATDFPFAVEHRRNGLELKAELGVKVAAVGDRFGDTCVVGWFTLADWERFRYVGKNEHAKYVAYPDAQLQPIRRLLVAETPYQAYVKRAGIYCLHCLDAAALWWWDWRADFHDWRCAHCSPAVHVARANPLL